ncbi:hypothetical protein BC835DRAFT_1353646 [Cytidiella melzeri]|nr:hypothetical protein BC835DRAFT_1353646 [Cytidiella melzeri]
MRSYIAAALALLATVGPAIAAPAKSLDAPSSYTVAAPGNSDVDDSGAMPSPTLSMFESHTSRRRGEPREFVLELLAPGRPVSRLTPRTPSGGETPTLATNPKWTNLRPTFWFKPTDPHNAPKVSLQAYRKALRALYEQESLSRKQVRFQQQLQQASKELSNSMENTDRE